MRLARLLLLSLLLSFEAHAAELVWDAQTITSPLTVERSATRTGPFTVIATLPAGATRYILTPGAYGWYQIGSPAGPSNVVQFSLDLYTGTVTDRLTALETDLTALRARVTTLENEAIRFTPSAPPSTYDTVVCYSTSLPGSQAICSPLPTPTVEVVSPPPAPSSNLTVRQIDADHIEITCNGIGITTSGSGTRRLMECRH